MRFARAAFGLALVGMLAGSCAYYNTYYLARKNYLKGTQGKPYVIQREQARATDFNKSIEFAKRVIVQYPKSKWVDDAYLLWAKALLGNQDPRETARMLDEFDVLYPNSPVRDEAEFILGVALRLSLRHTRALAHIDTFLTRAPQHELVPYAHLERSRVLVELGRPGEAATEAGIVIDRYGSSPVVTAARLARAEAHFAARAFTQAREDFKDIGRLAATDAERFDLLLREADCLEAARDFDAELALLRDALSHEPAPVAPDTTGGRGFGQAILKPGGDRFGRLQLRIGGVHVLAGRLDEAVAAFRRVAEDYPRTPLAAEAQYRLGQAYERLGEDFDRARTEYAQVREHGAQTVFATQASQRLTQLERVAGLGASAKDSLARKAESGFMLAEQYLLELEKPDRALEEYRRIANEFKGTPYGGKALMAEAWILARKLGQKSAAESLLWVVVREYPATEAQVAARDYLEREGIEVPSELIQMPEPPVAPTLAPEEVEEPQGQVMDEEEIAKLRARQIFGGSSQPEARRVSEFTPSDTLGRDSTGTRGERSDTLRVISPRDSTGAARDSTGATRDSTGATRDSTGATRDTTARPDSTGAKRDTTGAPGTRPIPAPADTTRKGVPSRERQ